MTNPIIELHISNLGAITIELEAEKSPKSSANFLKYLADGHFENTIFHRVIPGFMIQGGGMTSDLKSKPTNPSIDNEANNGLKNFKYTLAMARTGDPHSATSQFFINIADNDFLNHTSISSTGWGYAVFGKVTPGFDIVDKIASVETTKQGYHDDVPVEPVMIEKAIAL